jgi:predicted ATP-grasp superfamily ATP-dependent carboligase
MEAGNCLLPWQWAYPSGMARLGVLVTDADQRQAVAACESLGIAGYRVGTTSSTGFAPAQWSRFSQARFRTSDPRSDDRSFAEQLSAIASRGNFAAIVTGSDRSLVSISSHRELFPETLELGLPPHDVVEACVSKIGLLKGAGQAGLASRTSVVCHDLAEALDAAKEIDYPVMIKAGGMIHSENGRVPRWQSVMAWDESTIQARAPEFGYPFLLQARERGAIVSVGGVFADGRLVASATSRYIRTWRPDAGSVSYSETIDPPPHLLTAVEKLLGSMGWQGIFELELIERPDGGFVAIDLNPRLYGSLALALDAGASLPAIWCDWLLQGRAVSRTARPGVFYRWSDADVRHVWQNVREGNVRGAIAVLRPRRGTAHPYSRGRGVVPQLARGAQMTRNALSKGTRQSSRAADRARNGDAP